MLTYLFDLKVLSNFFTSAIIPNRPINAAISSAKPIVNDIHLKDIMLDYLLIITYNTSFFKEKGMWNQIGCLQKANQVHP